MSAELNDNSLNLDDKTCELLDLYAAGALEPSEMKTVQDLIYGNLSAKRYLDESLAMFASFEDNQTYSKPLLESVKEQIRINKDNFSTENAGVENVVSISSKRRFFVPFISGAVAASVVAVALSFALFSNSGNNDSQQFALDDELAAFSSSQDTKTVSLVGQDGQVGAKLMVDEQGNIMMDCRTLSSLDKNSTYQLWAVVKTANGEKVISAGVLGREPGVYMSRITGEIVAFSLTKEVSGGVDQSEQEAMYSASVA